jgi:hypothetical protein
MTNPVFKTFYNHRVFLIYYPDAYRKYLLGIVDKQSWPKTEDEQFGLKLGLMAWGTILVYQARMVASDFHRRLKALVDAEGKFLYQNPTLPLSQPIYRQLLTMQLGIEVITRSPEVWQRIEESPLIAQYIYDTLYMPSFYHERGPSAFTPDGKPMSFEATRADLRDYLWYRSGRLMDSGGLQDSDRPRPPSNFVEPGTLDYLFGAVLKRYFRLLSSPREIQEATRKYASELTGADRRLWLALADTIDTREIAHHSIEWRRQKAAAPTTPNAPAPPVAPTAPAAPSIEAPHG